MTAGRRILFVAHGPSDMNGPNVWLIRIASGLKRRGWEVAVLFLFRGSGNCYIEQSLRSQGVTTFVESYEPAIEKDIRTVLRVAERFSPDIVVPHLPVAGYYATRRLRAVGIPSIAILHSDDTFYHEMTRFFLQGPSEWRMEGVYCPSVQLGRHVREGNADIPLLVQPYGVEVPATGAAFSSSPFRVVFTGRLVELQKRISLVLSACQALVAALPQVECIIAGKGAEEMMVYQVAAASGGRIRYVGALDSRGVYNLLLQSHALLLLSEFEGLSISLMEAMACGVVPIVTPTRSGTEEVIQHRQTGWIVNRPIEDTVAAVRELSSDPGLWRSISEKARALMTTRYTVEHCVEAWDRFLAAMPPSRRNGPIQVPSAYEIHAELPPPFTGYEGLNREDHRMGLLDPSMSTMERSGGRDVNQRGLRGVASFFRGTVLDLGGTLDAEREIIEGETVHPVRVLKAAAPEWTGGHIPLPDASVDVVLAVDSLEWASEPSLLFSEIHRVLKPEGFLFFSTRFIEPLHGTLPDQFRYTAFSLRRLLGESGFVDFEVKALGDWNGAISRMMALWLSRAPVETAAREMLHDQFYPLWHQLNRMEEQPASFQEGAMSTGWSGTAFKSSRLLSAPSTSGRPVQERLAVIRPAFPVYHETAIDDRIALLAENPLVLHGVPPVFRSPGNSIVPPSVQVLLSQKGEADRKAVVDKLLSAFFRQQGVKAILAEYGYAGAPLIDVARSLGLRLVVHFQGSDASVPGYLATARPLWDSDAELVVVSDFMKERLMREGANPARLHVIPPGVDLPEIEVARPAENPPVLLFAGNFIIKKAPQTVLNAFSLVAKEVSQARLVMVGDGPLMYGCQALADQFGIRGQVSFLRAQSRRNLYRLMATSRVFVQHSVTSPNGDSEGIPLSILEAGAAGLPVIASRHAGIPEAVVDGETGLLVPERDIEALAARMLEVVKDGEKADALGRAGRRRIAAHFSRERNLDALRKVLFS